MDNINSWLMSISFLSLRRSLFCSYLRIYSIYPKFEYYIKEKYILLSIYNVLCNILDFYVYYHLILTIIQFKILFSLFYISSSHQKHKMITGILLNWYFEEVNKDLSPRRRNVIGLKF